MFDGFQIIYVEDDASVRNSLTQTLELAGFTVQACATAEAALPFLTPDLRGIVVSDVQLPKMSGLDLLQRVRQLDPELPVILVTAHGDVDMAVHAMRAGAYDFVEKPFSPERLVDVATRALEKRALRMTVQDLQRRLQQRAGIDSVLIGKSSAMTQLRAQLQNLADTSADVMVLGETGTGKELVARCLHDYSKRQKHRFVAVNCGGMPETLLESELFGHEAGAFTNAQKRRIGKIEHADQGTLFLDEIESMPISFQVRLLRVLQERTLERLGGNATIPVDVRVVAACKADLLALSQQQKFRSDLYYRLNVAVLQLPALRERREDIPELFDYFVLQAAAQHNRPAPALMPAQLRALMAHDWPGNVRELRNVANRFVLGLAPGEMQWSSVVQAPSLTLAQQMDCVEKLLIEQALKQHAGRPLKVIEALGIGKKTLYDKVHKYGIRLDDYRVATEGGEPE